MAIFHCVRNDVVRELPELRTVAEHRLRRIAQHRDETLGARLFAVAKLRDRRLDDRREIDRRRRAAKAIGLDARDREQVDDELLHPPRLAVNDRQERSEEHTSELQSLMRISYAVFCLKKKNKHRARN